MQFSLLVLLSSCLLSTVSARQILRTFSREDGNGNEKGKKVILHAQNTLWCILLPSLDDHNMKFANVTNEGHRHTKTDFVSLFKLGCSPLGFNSREIKLHLEFSGFGINATSLNKSKFVKIVLQNELSTIILGPWISPKCPHHIEWKMTGIQQSVCLDSKLL